ncbi:MAG TPA: 30S ribosomal protein S9 [Tepidisphaeraceae bacterium]|jgi:small subunit ribosomal protein S9
MAETETKPESQETVTQTAPAAPAVKQTFVWGTGRRKSAVARVRIATGSGKIEVNGRTLNDYFSSEPDRKSIFGPLEITNMGGKLDIFVNATGGGQSGQTGAIMMGLGRALMKYDPSFEGGLRNAGYLTRDSRMKERKKYGQRGARRRFQFSKR